MANNVVGPWEVDSDLDRLVRLRRHRVAERRRTWRRSARSRSRRPRASTASSMASRRRGPRRVRRFCSMRCCASPTRALQLLPPQTSATSRPRQARACSAPRSPVIPTRRRRATHRPRAPPASGGARSAPSRPTASTCSCNSRRPSMGWTRPSVWSPKPLTCKARPSTSSARPIPPSSPTSRSTRPDCWRGPCRFRRKKRPPSRTPPTNNAAHCTSRTIRHGRPRCSPRPGRIWWRWRKRTSTRPRTPRARRESWMGSTPSCSRRRSRPSRSTTFRTAAAFNWRIKSFYCLGAADRYAIETTSKNLLDAQQQVAAQYAMLLSG